MREALDILRVPTLLTFRPRMSLPTWPHMDADPGRWMAIDGAVTDQVLTRVGEEGANLGTVAPSDQLRGVMVDMTLVCCGTRRRCCLDALLGECIGDIRAVSDQIAVARGRPHTSTPTTSSRGPHPHRCGQPTQPIAEGGWASCLAPKKMGAARTSRLDVDESGSTTA